MSENPAYVLIVPHYSEVIFAFLNVIQALEKTPTKPLVLVQEHDTHIQQICDNFSIPTEIMPTFSWRNQLKGLHQCLAEPLRVRRFFKGLLRRRRITAIVLVDDRRYSELFLIQAARKRHIPTIVLMWAATNSSQDMVRWRQKSLAYLERSRWRFLRPLVRLLAPQALKNVDGQTVYWQHPLAILTLALMAQYPPQPWVFGGGPADRVAVIGPHYRDLLIADGVPPEKIVVTGHPRHDDLVNLAPKWRETSPEKPYILLAASPIAHIKQGTRGGHVSPDERDIYLHWVIKQLLELPYDVVVKPHPRDADADPTYLHNHSRPIHIMPDEPIAPAIALASLLVCQGSSVVLDACGLDTLTITFDFHNTPGYDMWALAGAAIHVTDQAQFLPTIQSLLEDTALQATFHEGQTAAKEHYMRVDGQATERVLDLIESLRKSKNSVV